MLLTRMLRHVVAINEKFETMRARQFRHEMLISIRIRPAQLVVEMNDGKNNAKLAPQLDQQPQKRNRINPARNGHADAVSGPQQILPPNVRKHALRQGMHRNMVPHRSCRDSRPGCPAEQGSAGSVLEGKLRIKGERAGARWTAEGGCPT